MVNVDACKNPRKIFGKKRMRRLLALLALLPTYGYIISIISGTRQKAVKIYD